MVKKCGTFTPSKSFIFFLYVYKNEYIFSIHCRSMEKNDVEVIEHGGEIWINQKYLEKKLDIANIADRTQYYSPEFKNNEMRNTRFW